MFLHQSPVTADNLATPILSSAKMNPWNPPHHSSLGNRWQSIRIHLGTHLGNSCLLSTYPVSGIGLGAGLEQQTKQNMCLSSGRVCVMRLAFNTKDISIPDLDCSLCYDIFSLRRYKMRDSSCLLIRGHPDLNCCIDREAIKRVF